MIASGVLFSYVSAEVACAFLGGWVVASAYHSWMKK